MYSIAPNSLMEPHPNFKGGWTIESCSMPKEDEESTDISDHLQSSPELEILASLYLQL